MDESVFKELYDARINYPLGAHHINGNDGDYIKAEVLRQDDNLLFLILTADYFEKNSSQNIKHQIEETHSLNGIYDLGALFFPVTGLRFYLYVFAKTNSRKLWFGEITEDSRLFEKNAFTDSLHRGNFPEYGKVKEFFVDYLNSINLSLNDQKKPDYISKYYRIFGCDVVMLGDRTSIDYYKPEHIEAEAKYAQEEKAKLGDIAEIIWPRELITPGVEHQSIKLSDASYPLRSEALVKIRENARIAQVKNNDIVTNQFLNSAFLNLTKRPDLAIANTQLIIRLHDKRFNHAYLTAYLNSERMRVYFERRKRGTIIPRLTAKDLADFEIVVPSRRTNEAANNFLSSLGEFNSGGERIKAINKVLFQKSALLDKPLQNELLSELHTSLQVTKNKQIRELFETDLHEIELCFKSGAYKACLVLCGSLLEALVLDWLSEVEQHNYFEDSDITNLESLINKLRSAERLSQHEAHLAHDIRKKRNLIHPKNYIVNSPLEKNICDSVMNDLRPLVRKRYEIAVI